MTKTALPQAVTELISQFPNAPIIESEYAIPAEDFDAQKAKQETRQSDGGAIGVVWLDDATVALVGRTKTHAGWALPGGTVEKGEPFLDTFKREMIEEVGVRLGETSITLMTLERRCWKSPTGERLYMNMAVFEAQALPGEKVQQTADATREGLSVQAFTVDTLPEGLIFRDKEKILQSAARRAATA